MTKENIQVRVKRGVLPDSNQSDLQKSKEWNALRMVRELQDMLTIRDQAYSVELVDGKSVALKRYDKKSGFWVELSFSESETTGHAELMEKLGEVYINQVLSEIEI